MCIEAVESYPYETFQYVPGRFKTQEMCIFAVTKDQYLLQFIPDWFITQKMCEDYKNDEVIFDYQKRKKEKQQIKTELLPITWHPDRYWDWCIEEDEKEFL